MFRPLSNCCTPSSLGIRQLEKGRISVIGSSFGKNVNVFITLEATVCWDPTYENLVVFSQQSDDSVFNFISMNLRCNAAFSTYFSLTRNHFFGNT